MEIQQIGRYQLKSLLGKGGMASVFLAHDPSFERDVAVKVLPKEFLHDETFRTRFQREAKTIAGMEHPAIVPVYDFGEENGQPFLVMRLMTGGSLTDHMEQGPLPLAQVAWVIERIASGFDAAHEAQIVHRDMKPSNILLDHRGNPYIADFGIARLIEQTAMLTGTGMIGTPAYMAPEMSDPGGLTHLIDVYALGVTAFQMVTGQLPYTADTIRGVLVAHATKPIPNPCEIQPDLPPELFPIIERAMAKEPEERYQSAGELAADLNVLTSGEASYVVNPLRRRKAQSPKSNQREKRTMDLPGNSQQTLAQSRRIKTMTTIGAGGGVFAIAIIVLLLSGLFPLGRTSVPPTNSAEIPQLSTESESLLVIDDATATEEAPTSTAVSLQPVIQTLFGAAQIKGESADAFVRLDSSQPLQIGDTVRTDADSAALIKLNQTVSFEVHPESEISLKSLSDSSDELSVVLTQASGMTYHFILPDDRGQARSYTLETPVSSISATGTEFWIVKQATGWCSLATHGSIRVDVAEADEDETDDFLNFAEDVAGLLVNPDKEVIPCTVDDIQPLTDGRRLIDATVTPTSTIAPLNTDHGNQPPTSTSAPPPTAPPTALPSTPLPPPPPANTPVPPPTASPVPPTNTAIPPSATPEDGGGDECGSCGDGGMFCTEHGCDCWDACDNPCECGT